MRYEFLLLAILVAFSYSTTVAGKPSGNYASKAQPSKSVTLNKLTTSEISKTEDIRNCYENSKLGKDKAHGVIAIEMDVGMRGEMGTVIYQKNQSTLNPEIGNCIQEAVKGMIIPFRSSERGKKVTVLFRF